MPEQKIDIAEQLDKLINIQKLDSVIYKLKYEKQQKPQMIENLKNEIEKEKKFIDDAKSTVKELQVKRKEKEVELETKENEAKKLNTQLYQLKTNKEYDAMQLEIKGIQADASVLEEDILKLMDEIEKAESGIALKQKESEQRQQETNAKIKRIESEIKVIEQELLKEGEKRKQLAQEVNPKVLVKYERILKGKEGLAMVPVADDACGGCHMQLPPQVINEIKLKHEIIYCQMCARILYDIEEQVT